MSISSYIGNKDSFIKRSNFRKKIVAIEKANKKRWCEAHPKSAWGKTGMGYYWTRCSEGHKKNEKCIPRED